MSPRHTECIGSASARCGITCSPKATCRSLDQGLLARAKQYIKNDEMQAAGTMRMTMGGRARASTIAKKKRDDSTNGGLFVVSEARAFVNDAQNTARRFSHMASGIGRGGTTADLEQMAYMHNKKPGNRPISEVELTRRAEAASAAPKESRRETASSNTALPEERGDSGTCFFD